jgi:hypothetical protein
MKVVECGPRTWDDHGLDIPHEIETIDFKVTGTGHHRNDQIYLDSCHDRAALELLDDKQPDPRLGAWLSLHACSFVMFDTRARCTIIGLERAEDADAFGLEFVASASKRSAQS